MEILRRAGRGCGSSIGVMIRSPGLTRASSALPFRPFVERQQTGTPLGEMPVDRQVVLHGVAFDSVLPAPSAAKLQWHLQMNLRLRCCRF